jgi:hypothetical protein
MTFVLMGVQWTKFEEHSTTVVRPTCPCTINMAPASGDMAIIRILGGGSTGTRETKRPGSFVSGVV